MEGNTSGLQFVKQPGITSGARIWRSLTHARLALLGLVMMVIILVLSILAPFIASHDPEHVDIRNRLKPPAWIQGGSPLHPLGTDNVGRDILSRLLYGSRISLFVGVSTVLLGGLLGTTLGLLAGYLGGRFETVVMRSVDIQLAFPGILFAVAIMSVLGPSLRNVVGVVPHVLDAPQVALVAAVLVSAVGDEVDAQLAPALRRQHLAQLQEHRRPGRVVRAARRVGRRVVVGGHHDVPFLFAWHGLS